MKIIVTHASAGAGHLKAAEAVYNHLKESRSDVDVEIVDCLDKSNPFLRFNYSFGYNFLVNRAPNLWAFAFWFTGFKPLFFLTRSVTSLLQHINTLSFAKYLIERNPDFIISTHFLPSEIAAKLKKSNKISSKVLTIITDYGVHPLWIIPGTDCYIAGSEFTKNILIKEGVEESRIKVLGIPIAEKFRKHFEKADLCQKFGISPEKFTILIMMGSFGIGPIEEIVEFLKEDVQILVVCAKNKKLFTNLNRMPHQNVKVFGFIDNVEELMFISDVIVTKPGGLSIAELLVMDLVPIFDSAIPGQETTNARFLQEAGIGINTRDALEVKKIVLDYKVNFDKLMQIKDKIKQVSKPFATEEICDAVCKGCI